MNSNRYPFNQTTSSGLFLASTFEMAAGYKFIVVFCAISTFYIGIAWYIETCIDDIHASYKQIDNLLASNEDRIIDFQIRSQMMRVSLKKIFFDIVQFHWRVLR